MPLNPQSHKGAAKIRLSPHILMHCFPQVVWEAKWGFLTHQTPTCYGALPFTLIPKRDAEAIAADTSRTGAVILTGVFFCCDDSGLGNL